MFYWLDKADRAESSGKWFSSTDLQKAANLSLVHSNFDCLEFLMTIYKQPGSPYYYYDSYFEKRRGGRCSANLSILPSTHALGCVRPSPIKVNIDQAGATIAMVRLKESSVVFLEVGHGDDCLPWIFTCNFAL